MPDAPDNLKRTDDAHQDIRRGTVAPLDLRTEEYKESRRLRAKALAKQAAGMQAARQAVQSLGGLARRGLAGDGVQPRSRQELAAQRQAEARGKVVSGRDEMPLQDAPVMPASTPANVTRGRQMEGISRRALLREQRRQPGAGHNVPQEASVPEPESRLASSSVEAPKKPSPWSGRKPSPEILDQPSQSPSILRQEPDSRAAAKAAQATAEAPISKPAKANHKSGTRPSWWSYAQYPLIAAVALAAAYSSAIGQWLILAYALVALVRRWESRYSFGGALFMLVTIPLFTAIGQSGIAQTAAVYVYELLVVGTIQAVVELRRSGSSHS